MSPSNTKACSHKNNASRTTGTEIVIGNSLKGVLAGVLPKQNRENWIRCFSSTQKGEKRQRNWLTAPPCVAVHVELKCKYTCLTPSVVHGTVKLKGLARTQIPTNRNDDAEFPTFGEIAGVNHSLVQWSSLALEEPPSWSWLRPLVQVSMPNPSFFKNSRMWFF